MTRTAPSAIGRSKIFRVIGAVLAVGVAVASTAASFSLVVALQAPAAAAKAWPGNSLAQANLASEIMAADLGPRGADAAIGPAERALAIQPDNVVAARTMAEIEAVRGHAVASLNWLHYAEAQSRRDLATQTMLIQADVARGDVSGALRHYDRALRTSEQSWPILFPVLFSAGAQPAITPSLARLLNQRPAWFAPFISQLTAGPTPFDSAYPIVRAIHLSPTASFDREVLANIVRKGVADRQYARTLSLLPGGRDRQVRNGGFEDANLFPPFDWALDDDGELSATVDPADNRREGNVLTLSAKNGRSGDVARQLLVLPPGRYALTLRSGNLPAGADGRPAVHIRCADDDRVLLDWRLQRGVSGAASQQPFTVPTNCDAQRLSIGIGAAADDVPDRPWIDDVRVARLVAGA